MNKTEKKSKLEKISRELYPSIRRNAKINVKSLRVLLRYMMYVEANSYNLNKFHNFLNRILNSKLDYKYYKRKINRYEEKLSFKDSNAAISLIFTQMIAEDSYLDIMKLVNSVRNLHMRSKLVRYISCNCPSIESIMSSFSSFKMTAIDDMDIKDRESLSARSVLGKLDSFIFMNNIKYHSESSDIDEIKFSKYGRVYIKRINYVYMGESKYTINMEVNLHSRYINDTMGLCICRKLFELIENISKSDLINQDISETKIKLSSIISGDKELNDSNDIINISSIQTDAPSKLIPLVYEFKGIMKNISSIDFKSGSSDSSELNKLLKELNK